MKTYKKWNLTIRYCLLAAALAAAVLGGALAMVGFLNFGQYMNSWFMILAAFFGSSLSLLFVLLIARKLRNMSLLVVCGVMIGYVCSAVTDFVVTFADDSNIVNLHNWSLGSFAGISAEHVKVMSAVVFVTLIGTFFLSKPMEEYQMGETYAQNAGVNLRVVRILLARTLFAPVELSVSSVTAVFLAPVVIYIMLRRSKVSGI